MPCAARKRKAVWTAASTSAPPTKRRASDDRAAIARIERPIMGLRASAMVILWKRLMGAPAKAPHYRATGSACIERP
ncbi:hypothetical protein G6F66_015730 [Rhizopus arrhizus]|nr:hypothetical protein G6F24_016902 [Rhizopus arrhizus]KAG1240571.1 hypothetical protein G6F66_015730 [Rhizopus arrhizus]